MVHTQSFELTGFQRDLLYVIAGSDQPSGQTIRRKLQPYIDNVNHGRLYPNLDELVDHGLVEKGSQDQRTNYYEVTPSGEQLLGRRREWENQYISFPHASDQQESDQLSQASSSSD
jgi:DNA-binding PadR family transcriptional regulator